jgi:ATP-dependent Clp protease ATP-binding subunit ClpB
LEDGRLTDNKGRLIDFKNTIIIMTSNLGSELLQDALETNKENFDKEWEKGKKEVFELLKKTIRPEFLNRIDEIIVFKPLRIEQVREIVVLQLNRLISQLNEKHIDISFTPKAIDYLAEKGFDPLLGARPVKRAILKLVVNELSMELIKGALSTDSKIEVDEVNNTLIFKRI